MPISKELQAKVDALRELAKKSNITHPPDSSPPIETALSRVIKTQEQADEFMKRLRALG